MKKLVTTAMLISSNDLHYLPHVRQLLREESMWQRIAQFAANNTPLQRARRRELIRIFCVVLNDVLAKSPLWMCKKYDLASLFPGRCAILADHLAEVERWACVYIDEGTREALSSFRHNLDEWAGDVIEANEDVALALKNHAATVRIGKL